MGHYFSSENEIEMIPVDFVAKSIVAFSQIPEIVFQNIPNMFHITNPDHVSYNLIFSSLVSSGVCSLSEIPYPVWREKLKSEKENPLSPLLPVFAEDRFTMYSFKYSRQNFETNLKNFGISDCFNFSIGVEERQKKKENLLHKYIFFLKDVKIIKTSTQ